MTTVVVLLLPLAGPRPRPNVQMRAPPWPTSICEPESLCDDHARRRGAAPRTAAPHIAHHTRLHHTVRVTPHASAPARMASTTLLRLLVISSSSAGKRGAARRGSRELGASAVLRCSGQASLTQADLGLAQLHQRDRDDAAGDAGGQRGRHRFQPSRKHRCMLASHPRGRRPISGPARSPLGRLLVVNVLVVLHRVNDLPEVEAAIP